MRTFAGFEEFEWAIDRWVDTCFSCVVLNDSGTDFFCAEKLIQNMTFDILYIIIAAVKWCMWENLNIFRIQLHIKYVNMKGTFVF